MFEGTVNMYADDTHIMVGAKTKAELNGSINTINVVAKVVKLSISIKSTNLYMLTLD